MKMNIFKRVFHIVFTLFALVYLETFLHIYTIGSIDSRFWFTALFCLPTTAFIILITSAFPKKINAIIYNILFGVICIYFSAELVYYNIFGGFLSISQVGMGGAAVTNFFDQTMLGIQKTVDGIIAVMAVLLISILLSAFKILDFERIKKFKLLIPGCSIVALHLLCLLMLALGGKGAYSVYDVYHSADQSTDNTVQNLGVIVTTRLETQHILFKSFYTNDAAETVASVDQTKYSSDEYNVTDIDFNEILKQTDSADAASLTASLSQRTPTKKNEYTGKFKGYNLITICAESYSPYLIDPERTPTLYKLSHEGFIFNNYFGSFESVTTNGEYTFCLGMFPDLSRSKVNNSFIASSQNALPYALGNMFDSIGCDTYAYHNFLGTYYSRYLSHPNMGYKTFKTPDAGLDIAPTWPSSDYDMMLESVDDYINSGKQFHAYYMTFSGHYQYNWENVMDARNKSKVKDLPYEHDAVKAYIAGNSELERALTYLVNRLEAAGIADKTVIVLTNDHYPYGLTSEEYDELAGEEVDTNFEKYRNSFICWNGGMKEPIEINEYCSTIDILPTILNLFGFEYDSRLIVGRDVMSDCEKIAILANQSFITEGYRFNAVTNELEITDEDNYDKKLVDEDKKYVKSILSISRAILNTDFYKYTIK